MQQAEPIVALLRGAVESFIIHRSLLKISVRPVGFEVLVSIDGHPGDLSRIIGKKGANFRALETLIRMAGVRLGLRVSLLKLKLGDPAFRDRYPDFALNRAWPKEDVRKLAGEMAMACLNTEAALVDIDDVSESDSVVTIRVEPAAHPADVARFADAAKAILAAAGSKCGRVIHGTAVANLRF